MTRFYKKFYISTHILCNSSARVIYFLFLENLSKNATLSLMKEIKKFFISQMRLEFLTTRLRFEMFERRRGSQQHWENSRSKGNELSRVRIICIEKWVHFCVCVFLRTFLSLSRREKVHEFFWGNFINFFWSIKWAFFLKL